MAAAAGKSKEADASRCRRHPSHRHAAGVCPFCLSDRLLRISAAAANDASSSSSSSSASSPRSLGEASVASAQAPPPCREARRARLGMLMRQEETDTAAAGGRHGSKEEEEAVPAPAEEKKPAKRGNFWARLQQASWYRRDGCSLAHSKAAGPGDKTAKRAPLF
uniref:Uncharacterized protein n=1 Tax=Avena sativa TaxID=4498 RepID=A0ACD6AFR0_AVESA